MRAAALLTSLGLLMAASGHAQTQSAPASAPANPAALADRQYSVRERLARLEARMLSLIELLGETEPQQAQRLRDGLDLSGRRQLKARLDQLAEALRAERLSDAERLHGELLSDLAQLMELLSSDKSELDRRRAERERLERQVREIRTLQEQQFRQLQQTTDLTQRSEPAAPGEFGPLEAEQLDLLRRTRAAEQDLAEPPGQRRPNPGQQPLQEATEGMRSAADALSRQQAQDARDAQQEANRKLQEALDELERALQQARREEAQETLAALESRLRELVAIEQRVRAAVSDRTADQIGETVWAEARTQQQAAIIAAQTTMRLLRDEGTTVIVPELMGELIADMQATDAALEQRAPERAAQLVDSVLALLGELLSVVEQRRDEEQAGENQQQGQGQSSQDQALLPPSAELRLLRSAQMQLNQTVTSLRADGQAGAEVQRLAERQRRLADFARRMNESKP